MQTQNVNIKVMFLKKDVLNNLTRPDKEMLGFKSNAFWCLYMQHRGEKNAFAECLSNYIFDCTGKRFNMTQVTANAVCHALSI